jgi:hypothetical protein
LSEPDRASKRIAKRTRGGMERSGMVGARVKRS